MKVDVQEPMPRVYVVVPHGDVDMGSSPDVRKALAPLFQKGTVQVIVDLSQVPYMDSSGIATLIEGFQRSQKGAIRFTLAGMNPSVEAAFDLAHLKDVFEVVPGVDVALGGRNKA
ncbi:MAG: STAS domain-containing protein [Thermodesulfobacteriota bacterium]